MTQLARRKRLCRYVCVGLMIALAPLAVGCYGSFPLTHAVHHLNGKVGDKLVDNKMFQDTIETVVFWILVIIPVYKVAIFADVVILNLIEFWSDETIELGMVEESGGTVVSIQPWKNGHEAVLMVSRDGRLLTEQRIVKVGPDVFEMRDGTGARTGTILKTPDGGIQLADAQGRIVRTLAAEDLALFRR